MLLTNEAAGDDTGATFLFAHGAGAPMDSPFMTAMAERLAARGVRVVRFEFPYMDKRRRGEKSGAPDRMPALKARFSEMAREAGERALFLGGKSMGGRVATMVADELGARGVVALGYPFHPPKKPAELRTAHLTTLRVPCLIVQGTRDPFGTKDELAALAAAGTIALSPAIELHFIEGGDHSLEPLKRSGRTSDECLDEAAERAAAFIRRAAATRAPGCP